MSSYRRGMESAVLLANLGSGVMPLAFWGLGAYGLGPEKLAQPWRRAFSENSYGVFFFCYLHHPSFPPVSFCHRARPLISSLLGCGHWLDYSFLDESGVLNSSWPYLRSLVVCHSFPLSVSGEAMHYLHAILCAQNIGASPATLWCMSLSSFQTVGCRPSDALVFTNAINLVPTRPGFVQVRDTYYTSTSLSLLPLAVPAGVDARS